MKKIVLSGLFLTAIFMSMAILTENENLAAQHGNDHEVHWGYEGAGGPEHWGDLKPEFQMCGAGMAQSPINIESTTSADLNPFQTDYKNTPLKIINNGHTIQVNYETPSTYMIDGKTYKLLQFHFHTPSEHNVNGYPFDMEVHLVHQNNDGQLAVLGVLMSRGDENPFIGKIWEHMPTEINVEQTISDVTINAGELLPDDKSYYHYYGSLTTPPCSEGVNWTVLKNPIHLSREQVQAFANLIGENARPVQPVNNRFILQSD